jgi:hypothetical protein
MVNTFREYGLAFFTTRRTALDLSLILPEMYDIDGTLSIAVPRPGPVVRPLSMCALYALVDHRFSYRFAYADS